MHLHLATAHPTEQRREPNEKDFSRSYIHFFSSNDVEDNLLSISGDVL